MKSSCELPPGFRFHPTDEELIVHYLRNQATSRPCPASIIPEINIYKFDPWELPEKSEGFGGEGEWYFFSPRDRKYPNGARPNRATTSGYWKATGTDKAIYSRSQYVGVKKALVFYRGRPPRGAKTDWIMHEYRLGGRATAGVAAAKAAAGGSSSSMRLDDWVLCRIYQKKHQKIRAGDQDNSAPEEGYSFSQSSPPEAKPAAELEHQVMRFPRSCSLAHLLEAEYMSVSQMLNEYPLDSGANLHAIAGGSSDGGAIDGAVGEVFDGDTAAIRFHMSGGNPIPVFGTQNFVVDPIFQY